MAQELLTTFSEELHGVLLQPSEVAGRFVVYVGDEVIWERKRDGGFPEPKDLKQRVRDVIAPEKDLGHSDRRKTGEA
jgi:selenoprotein W-related protein